MVRYFIIILIFILFSETLISQTSIIPVFGTDFSCFKSEDFSPDYPTLHINNKGYSTISPVLGLKLNHSILKDNASISLSVNYTFKKASASINGFAPVEAITFNYFQNNASFYYNTGNFFFGLGGSYNILRNVKYIYVNSSEVFLTYVNETGLRFSVGSNFNRYSIELYYYHALTTIMKKPELIFLQPVNSIGLIFGYKFIVLNKINPNHSLNCPKF